MQNFKFFLKIVLIIFSTFFMTYLITIITTIYISSNKFKTSLNNEFQYLLKHKNENFSIKIKSINNEIYQLLQIKDVKSYDKDNHEQLKKILQNHSYTFLNIYLVDSSKELILSSNEENLKILKNIQKNFNPVENSKILYCKELKKSIYVASRTTNDITFYFVVSLEKLIGNTDLGLERNYTLTLLNKDSTILLSKNKSLIGEQINTKEKLSFYSFQEGDIMGVDSFYYMIKNPYANFLITSRYKDLSMIIYEYIFSISLIYLLIFTIGLLVMYLFIRQAIRPIKKLFRQIEAYANGDFEYKVNIETKDEINMVAKVFNSLGDELQTNRKKLLDINNNLEKRVQEEVEINMKKEKIILEQSKHAAMGQMVDAVAHQWKQPLSVIKTISSGISIQNELGILNKEFIVDNTKNIQVQIDSLVETIDEFRGFFRPNPKKERVKLVELIQKVIALEKNLLIKNKIETVIQGDESIEYELIPAEFKHVFINFTSNAIDAFVENEISNRKIFFDISKNKGKTIIVVKDNAGGIPNNVIKNIFDMNFTTKEEGKGTGIGLYMSKQILEKINASIEVKNVEFEDLGKTQKGVSFIITLD